MIKDLRLSKIKSKSIQINDSFIEQRYVDEFVTDIEIESNYFRYCVNGNMTCNEELFMLSIGKSPEALKDVKITFYFEDEDNNLFAKSFYITNAVKLVISSSKNMWLVTFVDVYGKYLSSVEYTDRITSKGYTGKPLEIIKDVTDDLFDVYDDCEIKIVKNNLYFVNDNNATITHRFVKNKIPYENLKTFCEMYNIHIYQDSKALYFIQNPTLQNVNVLNASDGTSLYSETCVNDLYDCKICDKIKQSTSISNLDRVNYKISANDGGKKQNYKYLNFNDFLQIVLLNNNLEDFKNFVNSDLTYKQSSVSTIAGLVYDNYVKYLKANTLVIYSKASFSKTDVGTVVSVDIRSDKQFAVERSEGDHRFNGNWLITSSTIKLVGDTLFFRLKLNRFDNQKDIQADINIISSGESEIETRSKETSLSKRESILEKQRKQNE